MRVMYPSGLKLVASATGLNWTAQNYGIVLCKNTYVYNNTHANLSDILSANRLGGLGSLASKTVDAVTGQMKAADTVCTAVNAGQTVTIIAVYKNTGTESTSTLIYYTDESSAGLPFLGWGGDVLIRWPGSVVLGA